MMHIRFHENGVTPRKLRRTLNRAKKESWHHEGVVWHTQNRAKHFTKKGAREYGYTPRKGEQGGGASFAGSYTAQKLKRFGHTLPLVFTGEGRRLTKVARITSTSKGVKVRMVSARKFNFKPVGGRIDMADELRRVSRDEKDAIERRLERNVTLKTNQERSRSTKTIA